MRSYGEPQNELKLLHSEQNVPCEQGIDVSSALNPRNITLIAESLKTIGFQYAGCPNIPHKGLQNSIINFFLLNRWKVYPEYPVYYGESQKRGFVDILVVKNNFSCGIEIDNKTPRLKSMDKLIGFDYSVIVLRHKAPVYSLFNLVEYPNCHLYSIHKGRFI